MNREIDPYRDCNGQELNPGDRVTVMHLFPALRFTRAEAYGVSMPGREWSQIPPSAPYDPEINPLTGKLLHRDKNYDHYWIVGLNRPVFYSEQTDEGSPDVKELNQIREMGPNLRRLDK